MCTHRLTFCKDTRECIQSTCLLELFHEPLPNLKQSSAKPHQCCNQLFKTGKHHLLHMATVPRARRSIGRELRLSLTSRALFVSLPVVSLGLVVPVVPSILRHEVCQWIAEALLLLATESMHPCVFLEQRVAEVRAEILPWSRKAVHAPCMQHTSECQQPTNRHN